MSASGILLPLGSRIASVAGTAACVVAGAIAGQSVHRVPEGHHVVVRALGLGLGHVALGLGSCAP